ncbi:hypothetical protein PHLCEN_2v10151 [Hermanssonia centrifuga]|uniref:Uncharacterized protein n=1 Tax=Hermanssonia centrifuga TaxID=98765 RepID=A0A2R6NNS7_9APHY|nr:hypothetical protein PHLCEN_2v10151 [Hermanssonia centrifuga]
MFAQYSPLFTSGLRLSDSPSSSRAPSPERLTRSKPTHDSLPLTVNSATFSLFAGVHTRHSRQDSSDSAIFLTFKPSRRRRDEGHSFLSLDLSDARRSMSLRRKDTVTSRATTHFGKSEPTSPVSPVPTVPSRSAFLHSCTPSVSSMTTIAPRRSSPALRRSSRETLHLPSRKPAPSTSLPEVPTQNTRSRPSNLTLVFPAVPSASPSYHRSTHSAPSILSPSLNSSSDSPSEAHSFFAFSPTMSTPPTPPPTCTRPDSFVMPEPLSAPAYVGSSLRAAPSYRSTASVNTRQRERSAALAALEGRAARRCRASSVKRPRNFMSMSDDEDENENDEVLGDKAKGLLSVLNEEEDVVISAKSRRISFSPKKEKSSSKRASRTSTSSETKRSRRSTIESFFAPLTNFIDFRDEDSSSRSSRTWRSFVEISS